MRSVMLPKTNVIVRPSVKTESFTAEMGPVFNIMPDKIFRPKSVNAWLNNILLRAKRNGFQK